MKKTAYMDYNATTPLYPAVRDAMCDALAHVGNPSSVHRCGREARALIEKAREAVAQLVNAGNSDWVIFTSGGTEADLLALKGTRIKHVLVGATDHSAVLKACDDAHVLEVDANGLIKVDHLREKLTELGEGCLVSVAAANNETGVIQPLEEIVKISHEFGALVHSDAVQFVGKCKLDMQALGLDLVSLSSHKIGGPAGVGALVRRDGVLLGALQKGGGQERSMRGGTENLVGIVGFGVAATEKTDFTPIQVLRDRLETEVKARGGLVFGDGVERLPNTSYIALPGMPADRQIMALDLADVMVSAGSACSSGKVKASHVLQAMGVEKELAGCAIRVSLGWDSQNEDIDMFVNAWSKLAERAQAKLIA